MVSHHNESNLAEQAGRLLASGLVRSRAIAGGDLSAVVEVELAEGGTVIAKGGPSPAAEAEMLAAIRATGAAAPAVIAHDESVLVLEHLPAGGALAESWHDLGANLAKLHATPNAAASADQTRLYGWGRDYAFGSVDIENERLPDWPSFWAERRLANQAPHIAADLAARVERLAQELAGRLPAHPAPSLLHGDLWSGNILINEGHVTGLIDPACYYGHCEVDFAML
ncbi:MAG: fructosamine kinase family protein, partial [Gammaproteobacteria bacterium]